MKAKSIKAVLRKKYDSFLTSIVDTNVKDILLNRAFITGGSITSMLLNEKISDFDIYLMDKEACNTVTKYFVERFKANPPPSFKNSNRPISIHVEDIEDRIKIVIKSAGIAGEEESKDYQYFEQQEDPESNDAVEYVEAVADSIPKEEPSTESQSKPKYRPVFLTSNAITLSDRMQIICRFYGQPEEIHSNYDFIHCTCYWIPGSNKLVLPPKALECLLNKELRYMGSKYPICSVIRTRKFLRSGWQITAGEYLKMLFQVSQLDLQNISVLEDQLVGVDSAYFMEVISLLKERTKKGKPIDNTYLAEIIDKVF